MQRVFEEGARNGKRVGGAVCNAEEKGANSKFVGGVEIGWCLRGGWRGADERTGDRDGRCECCEVVDECLGDVLRYSGVSVPDCNDLSYMSNINKSISLSDIQMVR